MFVNGSEFKLDFTPLLQYLDIKHVLMVIKNLQANDLAEKLNQVIFNIIVIKDLDNKVF